MASTNWTPELVEEDSIMAGSNSEGFVVGSKGTGNWPDSHAVMWDQSGVMSTLSGMPAHTSAGANDINKTKTICGSFLNGGDYRAFWWQPVVGGTEIPALGTFSQSFGNGINDAGFIVGHANNSATQPTASSSWIWTKTGGLQELPKPSVFSEATDINNTGLISGWFRTSGFAKPIVWPIFGPAHQLEPFVGYDNAMAAAVNDAALVVGSCWTGKWNKRTKVRAVAWDGSFSYDLTSLFDEDESWALVNANDVNAKGDIAGVGTFNGQATGFLLIKKQ